jgi:predicted permease
MSVVDAFRHRLHVLLQGDAYEDEIKRELRFHRDLDQLANERSLGNETYYREEVRRMTLLIWFDRIRQDASYALRGLRRSPVFVVAVALTLGLGVGVNGAMYSLLSRLFFVPPSGVARPEQVRRVYATFTQSNGRITIPRLQYPQYAAMRAAVDSSIALGIFEPSDSVTMRDGNRRIPTRVSYVNRDFFTILGVRTAVGRSFAAEEDHVETPAPVMVIGDALWRRAFDADPSVLGRKVVIGSRLITIIGVAPPGFTGIDVDANEAWLPANMYEGGGGLAGAAWYEACCASFRVIARPANAGEDEQITTAATNAVRPVRVRGWVYDSTIVIRTGPILEALGPAEPTSDMRVAMRIASVVVLVLLIAVADVTNLLLLRAAARGREIAVRRALGVSRGRLFEQLAVEAVIVALAGGLVALLFATWAGTALRRLVLPSVHFANPVLDGRVILFVITASVLLGLLTASAPTLEATRRDVLSVLRSGTTHVSRRGGRLQSILLATQAALCVILLVGAGLFLRSFDNVASIGTGYETSNRIFLQPQFDDPSAHRREVAQALPILAERLRSVDGVEDVAFMNTPPIMGNAFRPMFLPGHDTLPQLVGGLAGPSTATISPGYFRTVGLSVVAGRDFTADDRQGTQPVAIVSRRLAQLYWPGENPIGKCIVMDKRDGPCTQVVGVAADAHRNSILEAPGTQYYLPIFQRGDSSRLFDAPRYFVAYVRAGRAGAIVHAADAILRSLTTDLLMVSVRPFDTANDRELRPWKLGATLFTGLGVLALLVAAVGVYSVVAYGVSNRAHEMGVRLALGARPSNIVDLVVGDGLRVVGIGVGVGIGASLLLGRVIQSLLFGIDARDVSVHIVASIVLIVVGTVACLVPAWRAARVNPVDALRAE